MALDVTRIIRKSQFGNKSLAYLINFLTYDVMDKGLIVHALIFNENKELLLIRRSLNETVLPGVWDIPGGTLEDGEDPKSGALRETLEETGLHVKDLDLFSYTSNIDQKKNKQFVRLIFIGFLNGEPDDITLNPEDHDEFRWVSLDKQVSDMNLVEYLPNILKVLHTKSHQLIRWYF